MKPESSSQIAKAIILSTLLLVIALITIGLLLIVGGNLSR